MDKEQIWNSLNQKNSPRSQTQLSLISTSQSLSPRNAPEKPKHKEKPTQVQLKKPQNVQIENKKTEICKNWQISGKCSFGKKCCFAHGKHELKQRKLVNRHFKTRVCLKYFENCYCPYGSRCQYLHKDAYYLTHYKPFINRLFNRKDIDISRLNNLKNYYENLVSIQQDEVITLSDQPNELLSRRLPIFKNICQPNYSINKSFSSTNIIH